jgi:hypothetical protein
MKKLIPKIIDLICFVGGSFLLFFNLVDLKYHRFGIMSSDSGGYYYYSQDNQISIAVGLGLIVVGFLIRSWRKDKEN